VNYSFFYYYTPFFKPLCKVKMSLLILIYVPGSGGFVIRIRRDGIPTQLLENAAAVAADVVAADVVAADVVAADVVAAAAVAADLVAVAVAAAAALAFTTAFVAFYIVIAASAFTKT
jgi:hypothetical protein